MPKSSRLATVVFTLLGLIVTPRPASAQSVSDMIGWVSTAISLYNQYLSNQLTLQDATNRVISQIQAAQVQIESHMDALEVAQDKACVDDAVQALSNVSANWGLISVSTMQSYAVAAQNCVSSIVNDSYVVGTPAVDQLGFALATIEPLVGMLNANAGWTTTAATFSLFRSGNTRVSTVLMASVHCQRFILYGDCTAPCTNPEVQYNCYDYKGDMGFFDTFLQDPDIPVKLVQAQVDSLQTTSYPLAQQGLASFP